MVCGLKRGGLDGYRMGSRFESTPFMGDLLRFVPCAIKLLVVYAYVLLPQERVVRKR